MCLGQTLAGALMEIFDDHWGQIGDLTRSITRSELQTYWVSLIAVPPVKVFYVHKGNLSRIGTDMQLLTGEYPTSREWFLRLANHPCQVDGFVYPSRHDNSRQNFALLRRSNLLPAVADVSLTGSADAHDPKIAEANGKILYGPPLLLANHPELDSALKTLMVAKLP